MNDKELLEFAAKAVALPECGWMGPAFMYVKDNTFTDWNPITDDGDALRLAVKLRLSLVWWKTGVGVESQQHGPGVIESFDGDPQAATRRAIVYVAATIGKEMT
jgi:hypothetical protein